MERRPDIPALPTTAISVKAAASEKQEQYDDDQNGCHDCLQCMSSQMSVRGDGIASLGIYLHGEVRSGRPRTILRNRPASCVTSGKTTGTTV
jgi:hypothetical protein